jgi:transcriptional regulator with PAS, ATPase and Fis domain
VVFAPVMRSASMKRLEKTLQIVATKDVIVTLIGESGTGKEVLARRVHELSDRRRGPFIPINCAAIPEALFESELFGHERGAFTGANERAKGKVEAADQGTLFLDEIGEMPLAMQAKLLRFLENRRFMRVGGTAKIQADIRLVFATLRPLDEEVKAGRFRADLFYRIQGITLVVPPLRDRAADIAPLIHQFTEQLSARHGTDVPRLTREAKRALHSYAWPGNVRELRNVVESLCLLRAGKRVTVHDLPAPISTTSQLALDPQNADEPTFVDARHRVVVSLDWSLEKIVDVVFEAAIALEGGNKTRAAERLGVSVRTLQRRTPAG